MITYILDSNPSDHQEREFSDDEAELEHKRSLKRKRMPETEQKANPRRTESQRTHSDRDQFLPYRPLSRPTNHSIVSPRRHPQARPHPESQQDRGHHLPQQPPALGAPQYWAEYSPSAFPYGHSYPLPLQVPDYMSLRPGAYVNPTFFARNEGQPVQPLPLPPDIQQQIDILSNIHRRTQG
jgi:hypothetical protein